MLHHGGIWWVFDRVGWVGVDLFFVLSGFLISGLLFADYKRYKAIRLKRFLVRRALKIYPAYYVFLLLTGLATYVALHAVDSLSRYFYEIFFLMNYAPVTTWPHIWSLAVEEHFYIVLPLFLMGAARFFTDREDPFRILTPAMGVIATLCIGFRAAYVFVGTPNFEMAYKATHTRMDSLFFGVLIGYFYHFRRETVDHVMGSAKNCAAIAAASCVLLAPAYFWSTKNRFFATFGYSSLYLAFGGVLLLCLYVRGVLPTQISRGVSLAGTLMASIGMYSYSIYLWHVPIALWLAPLVRRVFHISTGPYEDFGIYLVGSLVTGIVMSRLIEYPILRLRDRFFPSTNTMPIVAETIV
jgi:peptidoglycan/LPS O-acetylase OafA/YrhL